jgi:hypothetical protein
VGGFEQWACSGIVCVTQEDVGGEKRTIMKKYSLSGARIAQLSCIAFVLLGFSQTVQAQPATTSPDYSVSVFANAPAGLSNPDSITSFQGTIFVEYANGTQPDGTGGNSSIVQFDSTGKVLHTYQVVGKSDGMKFNPFDGHIWCLRDEDSNPALTLIDPVAGTQQDYTYADPTLHGGGYDDVVFLNGQVFISASNPNLQPPTPQTPNGQNIYPSIVKAAIIGTQVFVQPVLNGNATLTDITTGKSVVAQQSDPDSLKVDPSGNLVLDSQGDGDLIFLNAPGFPNQTGYRLHLSNGTTTQVTVDDTVYPTQASGTIYVVDTQANTVYAVTSHVFPPNAAFGNSDGTGVVGRIDLQTGKFTPIVTGLKSPHGALFVSTFPEVRLEQVTTSAGSGSGLVGKFRVSRSGDVSQALTVFLNIVASIHTDPVSQNTVKSITIPAGAESTIVSLPLDSEKDFKEDGSAQNVLVSIAPDPNYNIQSNIVNTGVQGLSLPLPK